MADLTREELVALRGLLVRFKEINDRKDGDAFYDLSSALAVAVELQRTTKPDTLLQIVDMALRCVSEETMREFEMYERLVEKGSETPTGDRAREDSWDDFLELVQRDLRESASPRGRAGEE